MTRRAFASATLVAALALSVLPGAAAAQDAAEPADDDKPDKSITGSIIQNPVDGIWYLTPVDGDPIELEFGPSWFNDLTAFFELFDSGTDGVVTIGGNVRDGMPNENASDTAKAAAEKDPKVRILTVGDQRREEGKPPWAGGPKGNIPPGQAKKDNGNVPPGQAKKDNGNIPPGQAKKDNGNIPPGQAKKDK